MIRRWETKIWLPCPTLQQYVKMKPDFVCWQSRKNTCNIEISEIQNGDTALLAQMATSTPCVFTAPTTRKSQCPSCEGHEKKLFQKQKNSKTDLKQKFPCFSQIFSCVFIESFYLKVKSVYSYYWAFRRLCNFKYILTLTLDTWKTTLFL